jgi:hypothetical protein
MKTKVKLCTPDGKLIVYGRVRVSNCRVIIWKERYFVFSHTLADKSMIYKEADVYKVTEF